MRTATPFVLGLIAVFLYAPALAELSSSTKKREPWERSSAQTEEVIRHLSSCAVAKMSPLAKKEIIKRRHEATMTDIKQQKDGLPPLMRIQTQNNECNTDITEPLVRSCAEFPVRGPELRMAECRVNGDLISDEEFRALYAPYRAKEDLARQEAETIQQKREVKLKAAQTAKEAWLFK